jgi:hypothetical protein
MALMARVRDHQSSFLPSVTNPGPIPLRLQLVCSNQWTGTTVTCTRVTDSRLHHTPRLTSRCTTSVSTTITAPRVRHPLTLAQTTAGSPTTRECQPRSCTNRSRRRRQQTKTSSHLEPDCRRRRLLGLCLSSIVDTSSLFNAWATSSLRHGLCAYLFIPSFRL